MPKNAQIGGFFKQNWPNLAVLHKSGDTGTAYTRFSKNVDVSLI